MFRIAGAYVFCTDPNTRDAASADGAPFYGVMVGNLFVCVVAALSVLFLLPKLFAMCAASTVYAREVCRVNAKTVLTFANTTSLAQRFSSHCDWYRFESSSVAHPVITSKPSMSNKCVCALCSHARTSLHRVERELASLHFAAGDGIV